MKEHKLWLCQLSTHQNAPLDSLECFVVLAIPGKAPPLPTSKANSRVPQGVEMQVTEKVQSCAESTKRVTSSIPSAHVPQLGSDIPSDSMLSLVCPSRGRASGRVKYLYIFV